MSPPSWSTSPRGPKPQRSVDYVDSRGRSAGLVVSPSPPQSEMQDDSDDDGGEMYPQEVYNHMQEPLPDHPAFDATLRENVDRAADLLDRLLQKLQPYRHLSPDIDNMARKVQTALRYPQVKKPTIMLLGDTGTGKSGALWSCIHTKPPQARARRRTRSLMT